MNSKLIAFEKCHKQFKCSESASVAKRNRSLLVFWLELLFFFLLCFHLKCTPNYPYRWVRANLQTCKAICQLLFQFQFNSISCIKLCEYHRNAWASFSKTIPVVCAHIFSIISSHLMWKSELNIPRVVLKMVTEHYNLECTDTFGSQRPSYKVPSAIFPYTSFILDAEMNRHGIWQCISADSLKIDLMPTQIIERCGRMFQFCVCALFFPYFFHLLSIENKSICWCCWLNIVVR